MIPQPPFIVFSDLDGTLLDHTTYGWRAAEPALRALKGMHVPVILASSKTAAEMAVMQRDLGLEGLPAIVENGAGMVDGGGPAHSEPDDYTQIRAALHRLPQELRAPFVGFGDLDHAAVARLTGLSNQAAIRAKDRRFSEPGEWRGTERDRLKFEQALRANGILARQGGRFLTLSFGASKADQMARIAERLGRSRIVALGDAPNDIEMLEAADIGVIVHNPHRPAMPRLVGEDAGHIQRTTDAGPLGWNTAMLTLIEKFEQDARKPTLG